MTKRKAKAETYPPAGHVQALPVVEHGDNIAEDVATITLTADRFPTIIRAMNLIREDNGGPSWPPEEEPKVAMGWASHLHLIETALAHLSDSRPAGEDPEPTEGLLGSELYTFCNGEHTVVEAIKRRGPSLEITHSFLNDFFEGWSRGGPA